ncbi:hypothetical protein HanRHA438_Chr04g0173581 [Helianthus annuus]|nr:hypothetical protein HanRHA438_Chr04g0173581 [Helianthus annuus]
MMLMPDRMTHMEMTRESLHLIPSHPLHGSGLSSQLGGVLSIESFRARRIVPAIIRFIWVTMEKYSYIV